MTKVVDRASAGASSSSSQEINPVQCVAEFFPRSAALTRCIEFSVDGLHCISAHSDDAVRWVDTETLSHRETISLPSQVGGVHRVAFGHASSRFWVAPRVAQDPHIYVYSSEKGSLVAAYRLLGSEDHTTTTEPSPSMASSSSSGRDNYPAVVPPPSRGGASVVSTPRVLSMATSPVDDVLVAAVHAGDSVQFFHPMVNRPVASTVPSSRSNPMHGIRCARWSVDGVQVAVGASERVAVFDLRKLTAGPLWSIENMSMFPHGFALNGANKQIPCVGVQFHSSGSMLLATSAYGETVCVDPTSIPFGRPVASTFFQTPSIQHKHFRDHGHAALGAMYLSPRRPDSLVVQAATTNDGGRHVLISDGFDGSLLPGETERRSLLKYVLQLREAEAFHTMAVNPVVPIFAVGGRGVTWCVVNNADDNGDDDERQMASEKDAMPSQSTNPIMTPATTTDVGAELLCEW